MSDLIGYETGDGILPQPKFVYPKPDVHPKHPLRDQKNHQAVLDYIMPRVRRGLQVRDSQLDRMVQIDKAVAGWMKMSEKDRARMRKRARTGIPQATLANLPITWVQLDDLCTYYTQTFMPGKAMFYHAGKPDEAQSANQVVMLMNNHSIYAGYYRHLFQAVWAQLKYNLGGIFMDWEEDRGPKVQAGVGTVNAEDGVVWAGNRWHSLDMYNTFYDPLVHPTMVYKDGEYAGRIYIKSHYWFSQRALNGVFYNCESLLNDASEYGVWEYYKHPPAAAQFDADESTTSNWVSKLSDMAGYSVEGGYEFIEITCRLNPTMFGLVPNDQRGSRNRYELWRFVIANGKQIVQAQYLNNIHNHIPYYMGMINDDGMGRSQKSTSEIMEPFQNLASHVMNIFIQATRKNLFGLTVYDKRVVDLSKLPEDEIAGRIAAEPLGTGMNIRDGIWRDDVKIDTEGSMNAIESIMGLLNQFFPAQAMPSQIAGIDRAVSQQVAAVQNGVNRRQQKTATLLDNSFLRPMRFGMYYNILQYQADGEMITDFRGRPVAINLSELRATDLPFIIGMGLKAIDRLVIADRLQQVIFALIQNPQAAQRIDILRLIDYWTDMMDIEIDMTQFELQPQTVAENAQAEEGVAPAEGTGVTPMTNPGAITEAIYG